MLWLNFILGFNFIFLCLQNHYHTFAIPQNKRKLKPKIKLNCNIIDAEDNLRCKDHQSHHNSSRHVQDPSQTALNENDKHCSPC